MTVPERVVAHLGTASGPLCDDCIQAQLGLPQRQQVQQITSTLGLTSDYERRRLECVGCGGTKMTIAAKGAR